MKINRCTCKNCVYPSPEIIQKINSIVSGIQDRVEPGYVCGDDADWLSDAIRDVVINAMLETVES